MKHIFSALLLGLGVALIGQAPYFSPAGSQLEEQTGLKLLFRLRGKRPAAPEVAIVAIEKTSSDAFGLPNDPQSWPRSLHAQLIERLTALGARLIVFDLFFRKPQAPEEDEALAAAMRGSGKVILYGFLNREIPIEAPQGRLAGPVSIERIQNPIPVLANAALALAPFPLPKVPVSVSNFWTFRREAADAPTLPSVTLQAYALMKGSGNLMKQSHTDPLRAAVVEQTADVPANGFIQKMIALREATLHPASLNPSRAEALLKQDYAGPFEQALHGLYAGPERRYLNFYGPPYSLRTFSYAAVLDHAVSDLQELHDKVVFVGFSERRQPEQKDSYYTAFSRDDGSDLAGVEILATAFANLLHREHIRPLPHGWLVTLITLYGFLIVFAFKLPSPAIGLPGGMLLACSYFAICLAAFTRLHLWLPWIVPLLIQTPLALAGALIWRYADANRERRHIRKAFSRYLPERAVTQLMQATALDVRETLQGVCLFTDMENYTRLSETLTPKALGGLMSAYYERLFKPVSERGGFVSDIIGDSMLAIWTSASSHGAPTAAASRAALDILRALDEAPPTLRLPTRIGLHAGEIVLGNIGAADHYEYRAIGDIVNTANRIQSLNKVLSTRLLVSKESLPQDQGFLARPLGSFRLPGKQQSQIIHELLGFQGDLSDNTLKLCEGFAFAHTALLNAAYDEAERCFRDLLNEFPDDGPSRFFMNRCQSLRDENRTNLWDGTVVIDPK